jgi:GDSL-like Lipase/Acylhydrolase family
MTRRCVPALILAVFVAGAPAFTQINFPKTAYYAGMGDSVAAGEGALPVTQGYVYRLYEQGVFGAKQQVDFANLGVRGTRSWDLRDHQVPQVLCANTAMRPTVITITSGAIDFLTGDFDFPAIAQRVAEAVHLLLNNDTIVAVPVRHPVTTEPCPAVRNATILVSNYYRIPHPDPGIEALIDGALSGFDVALRAALSAVPVPPGSHVAVVDLYAASLGRTGLVTLERRLGFQGPFDFDVHPTNLGHAFIAQEFGKTWKGLQ